MKARAVCCVAFCAEQVLAGALVGANAAGAASSFRAWKACAERASCIVLYMLRGGSGRHALIMLNAVQNGTQISRVRKWIHCTPGLVMKIRMYQVAAKDSCSKFESEESVTRLWSLAPSQISRTMMQQCRELDQQIHSFNFDEMELQLQDMLSESPELTLAHFGFSIVLIMVRVGAHEHFHRYYDYAMIQERKHRLAMPNLPEESNASNA